MIPMFVCTRHSSRLFPMRAGSLALRILVLSHLCLSSVHGVEYDIIIRGGTVYDGNGDVGRIQDVAIRGDRIAAVGNLMADTAPLEINATGFAVAPGFVNMLSWAVESLLADGRSESDVRQGVTLEVFGEGVSWGPWNQRLKQQNLQSQGDIRYAIEWTTLAEFLEHLTQQGTSCNVASFIGATTVRMHELGSEDRAPTREELDRMRALVRQAMQEGALGVASALIYAPAFYAKTEELIALAKVAAEYDGLYATHMRSEGNRLLEGIDETLQIAREAGVRTHIYHLKAAGQRNWSKLDQAITSIDQARSDGLEITADMYTYPAAATGLDASMPPWVQEGGYDRWRERLLDPRIRLRVLREMRTHALDWENLLLLSGSAEKVLLIGFKNERLKPLTGKTLAEVARLRGRSPEETAMDLVIEDGSRVGVVYFLMSEENLSKQVRLPWVSFCSDAESLAPRDPFLRYHVHPRAYGSFARLLGKYVRDEQAIPLGEAIRRLTWLPAQTLRISNRGRLLPGYHADVVVFAPDQVQDHATFASPHQFSTGMQYVLVNGEFVIRDGEHTGATPGQVVYGPGRATPGLAVPANESE
jgi:N-acyl-D-amino-acid deacylase